jgi:cellulose synthase/poly-beta-1,6-N-acetylglucosamine synthase-like glycosyltransferase
MFRETGADVVQGGVQLMNLGTRPRDWYKVHNVLEYFSWFSSRMFYQIACGFVPLGGNTVFIRRDMLAMAGGWPLNLTEDCALGVLLCTRYGAKVVAAYDPELATREEVPATIFNKEKGSLLWQRERWNRGFLSILLQGLWLELPTFRQRLLAAYILATPFLQAASGLLVPVALATILLLKVPVFLAMLMFVPFIPITITVTTQVLALREFSLAYRQRARLRHYVFLLLGAPLYQFVLMGAALLAVYNYARGNVEWYKTGRANAHRPVPAAHLLPEAAPHLVPEAA